MLNKLELKSEHRCYDGWQRYYEHPSSVIGLPMRFSIYLPPQAQAMSAVEHPDDPRRLGQSPCPVLFFLAGLTCTEETFMIKAAAQRFAAEQGMILVTPDTSRRGAGVAGEDDDWDFGTGAGFYLDATQAPWSQHYRMESYIVRELYPLITEGFGGADAQRVGICGHSMGGLGAVVLAQRHPGDIQSVSASVQIPAPTHTPFGHKAFSGYFRGHNDSWRPDDPNVV